MESPLRRLRRAFAGREPDWTGTAIAYAAITLGAGLILYGLVAQ